MKPISSISIYKNIYQNTSTDTVTITEFLENIQSGKWQDKVLPIRLIQDHEERKKAKEKLPYVTISGMFMQARKANEISEHSGFISMDIDNVASELEGIRTMLSIDPYVYSVFTSVSGTGLCVLFKIDPDRHLDAFNSIADYLLKKYQIVIDPSGKDVSRPRYVSYDPHIVINPGAVLFKKYLPKEKKRKIVSTIFVQTEFDNVVNEMVKANVSCVDDYRDWLAIGFGLADQFGEAGRQYFHSLSSCSTKYEKSMCDRQYTHCLKHHAATGKITISTIYWFAKNAGISIYSEQTKKIAAATSTGKAAGLSAKQVADNLKKHEGIDVADEIIQQAFSLNTSLRYEESLVENVRMWLRHNFKLKKNAITRKIENDGEVLEEMDFNTMFLDAKILFNELSFDLFFKVIMSRNTPTYNPIIDFIGSITWDGEPRIDQLGACINSTTGTMEWRCKMVRKWYVGIVCQVFGVVNELNFILVGGKNTGKTRFFTGLLPVEMQAYFGRSQLMRGTDDEILMCEKLIVFNDEYGGKGKADERNEKRLMASPGFSLRVPYGKGNEDVIRLATLCGTCNDLDVLDDATGNRRIIVMQSAGKFDYALYNSLDKYQMFAEAYQAFRNGERPEFTDDEIDYLESVTDGAYSKVSVEGEMIQKYFLPPSKTNPWDHMSTTEIKLSLESHTKAQLNINKIGAQLRKLGYTRSKKDGIYGYDISTIPVIFTPGN